MRLKNAFNNIFLRIRIGLVLLIGIGMPYFSYAADELQSVVPLHTFTEHKGWVYSVSFSPGGQTLASGSDDGTVRLWDVNTGNLLHTLTEHRGAMASVLVRMDGRSPVEVETAQFVSGMRTRANTFLLL